jgi:hypothetical protein
VIVETREHVPPGRVSPGNFKAMRTITTLIPLLLAAVTGRGQSAGPVYYWPLDEAEGTTAQELMAGQHGTVLGEAAWYPSGGHHGGAIRFNAVDQRITVGACEITSGTGFAISVWVKPDMVSGNERMVVAKTIGPQPDDQAWSLSFVNATALRFRLRLAGTTHVITTSPLSIFSGAWYHVVGTYDGAQMKLYVNGSMLTSTSVTGALGFNPDSPAAIGAQFTGTAPFSGWVDDLRIYDHGLSDQEIYDLLLGDVVTGMDDLDQPWVDGSGHLRVPGGPWSEVEVFDLAGRMAMPRRSLQNADAVAIDGLAPGIHLVRLLAPGRETTRRVFIP